jgi:hypothetical protein
VFVGQGGRRVQYICVQYTCAVCIPTSGHLKSIPTAELTKKYFFRIFETWCLVEEPKEVKCLKGMIKRHILAGKEKRMSEEEEIADVTARKPSESRVTLGM